LLDTLVHVVPASVVRQKPPSPLTIQLLSSVVEAPSYRNAMPTELAAQPLAGACVIHVLPPSLLSSSPALGKPFQPACEPSKICLKSVGKIASVVTSRVVVDAARSEKLWGIVQVAPPSVESQNPSVLPRTPWVA
jgi:hypothetical protein